MTRDTITEDNASLAILESAIVVRGGGGGGSLGEQLAALAPMPERPADLICPIAASPQQALLYRLSGDDNPLHTDPEVAARAGFERPILHGLATWGMACRALITATGKDLRRFDARFTGVVYPGEPLELDVWHEPHAVRFRARVPGRDTIALDQGLAEFR